MPYALAEPCQHHVGSVDLGAGAAEVLADRAEVGAPADAVFHELGGLRLVRIGPGACVDAQLRLECLADRSCLDEADQALGEGRCLRPGGQPDSQPPGGDMIDGAAMAVSCSDTIVDEALVEGQVREQPILGEPAVTFLRQSLPILMLRLAGQSAASRSGSALARSC